MFVHSSQTRLFCSLSTALELFLLCRPSQALILPRRSSSFNGFDIGLEC
jgi:hypothetical protein